MLQVSVLSLDRLGKTGRCHPECHQPANGQQDWSDWRERVQFDPQDAALIGRYKWHLSHNGRKWRYAMATVSKGRKVALHRMILGVLPGIYVDHINGDTLDNRRANLRFISNGSNVQNQHRPRGKSRFQGVAYQPDRAKPWRAQIMHNYRKVNIGNYATEIEAAAAYDRAAVRMFGPGAKQNLAEAKP